jgi:beta-lactamase superfamily II metal-dependent hydrolase
VIVAKSGAKKNRPARKGSKNTAFRTSGLDTVRIRMYRVGFGDFFLMTVPAPDEPQHVLIDCGVTRGKSGKGDLGTIKTAVRHMADETGSRLALIIATHRHQDHIVGFSRCLAEFEKFKVDAIWMPFWETEYAPEVQAFQAELQSLAFDLRAAALAEDRTDMTDDVLAMVENATGMSLAEGPGGGTNAKSLDLLKNKLGVKPNYYVRGQQPNIPEGLVRAGVTAEILGPPNADALAFVKLADLKKGVGQYLGAAGGDRGKTITLKPFGAEYVAEATDYPPSAFREWAPRTPGVLPDFTKHYPEALEKAVKGALPLALFLAAKKLDNMLNNQSLVVLFTWRGKKLLFAGDAQGGNWEYWMYDMDKPRRDPTGEALTADSRAVLGALDFYKVGHHGSTNATPIAAVEAMGGNFVSMCSTQAGTFGSVANESEVPRVPLLDALSKKSAIVRSDQIQVKVNGVDVPPADGAPSALPQAPRGKFVVGSCFVDYLL